MQLKIISEVENPLFNRREIKAVIEAEITPKISETEKFLSEKFSVPVENIKIKKVSGKFGSKKFAITANIYTSRENKEKIEPKILKKEQKTPQESKIKETQ